jgi:hypothetical protein
MTLLRKNTEEHCCGDIEIAKKACAVILISFYKKTPKGR